MDFKNERGNIHLSNKARISILIRRTFLFGIGLSFLLTACSPAGQSVLTRTAAIADMNDITETPSPAPIASPTDSPATITTSPSVTPAPPLSPVVMQALKDAFNCLSNNMVYAPNIPLTQFCPGYWGRTSSNRNTLDGVLIRKQLEPYLSPLSGLRWRFTSLTDVQKDERLSTTVNQVYTARLSTTLTGDVNLECPSSARAPSQTSVSIPVNGEARISVYNYRNQAQETIQIESWTIEGNPLEDYCSTLH
jgi:hypothetical protein